jgi:hypothetical protein
MAPLEMIRISTVSGVRHANNQCREQHKESHEKAI